MGQMMMLRIRRLLVNTRNLFVYSTENPLVSISLRLGPVPTHATGTPVTFSMRLTYACAAFGKSFMDVQPRVDVRHPGRSAARRRGEHEEVGA